MTTAEAKYETIVATLASLANPQAVAGMARYGITAAHVYGVAIPDLRRLAKQAGVDHDLAQRLWADDSRETRILACLIVDPLLATPEQLEAWVRAFDGSDRTELHHPPLDR